MERALAGMWCSESAMMSLLVDVVVVVEVVVEVIGLIRFKLLLLFF